MVYALSMALFLPLFGFLVLMMGAGKISRTLVGIIGSTTVVISFVLFAGLLYAYTKGGMRPETYTLFSWIPIDRIGADVSLRLDPLSLLMTLIVTGIGSLIHIYSMGYMDHEEGVSRYFACLNFFIFMMLLLVLASNVLLLFVGWEGVGLASYLLIGFWYQRPSAAQAATKAFVVNRIGDVGFLLALLMTFALFGTGDIVEISRRAPQELALGGSVVTLLTLLYFWGAIGKSAQLPLYTWLPDAMEGPTPVSALIHAATMVTAGVYLVVRLHTLFMLAPVTLLVIGVVGAVTSLFAALCAIGQRDLKRVLAYSTVSQLGLMFLACGVGAFYAAMFHLTTHAFVKGLLFLSAGNVVHMMHGTTDMGKMGGMASSFKVTHWLFLIGVLALSGIPPLSPFFSKELILEQEYLTGFKKLFYIGLAASILTAFYMTRAYCLTFLGKPNSEGGSTKGVEEAPNIMLLPLVVLALFSVGGGFLGFAFGKTPLLESFLAKVGITLVAHDDTFFTSETWMAIIGALGGVGVAAYLYTREGDRMASSFSVLTRSFFVDEIYSWIIVKPLLWLACLTRNLFEPRLFDGSVRAVAKVTQRAAHYLQLRQNGQIRSYVAYMVLGTVFLIVYLAL